MYLLLTLILIPVLEIAIFIQIGSWIGALPTVGLILLMATLGMLLLRREGLATLLRAHASLDRGELPVQEAFDGLCLLLAGALFLIPGFLTDVLALALFVPWVRVRVRDLVLAWIHQRGSMRLYVDGVEINPSTPSTTDATTKHPPLRPLPVIEGEYRETTAAADSVPDTPRPPETNSEEADLPPSDSRWGSPHSKFRR